jgi:pilus assembly protein CpaC
VKSGWHTPTFLFLGTVVLCAAPASVTEGQTTASERGEQRPVEMISLFVGRSTILPTPWPVSAVSVAAPQIADVQVLTEYQVLVLGKSAGTTDVFLLSEGGEHVREVRVDVAVDVARIKADLARLFPDSTVDVSQSEDVVLLTGMLSRAEQVDRLHRFLDAYGVEYVDMTELAGVQQVQLQVRVAEASRTAIRALSLNALLGGTQDNEFFGASLVGSASGGAFNPISIGPPEGAIAGAEGVPFVFSADVTVTPLVTLLAGFPRADLEFFLGALAENQYVRILAEPNLVALSGEEASFLAGGEFPIPVVQGGVGGSTSISVEFQEFGVRLHFRPTVLGDNRIRLWVAPEVSELTDTGAVEIQGFRVPAIVTRRAETTLELKNGQTFAMAGLLQQTNEGRTTRIPGLGDLPVLGALFRSVRYEQGETELLVLVTASLVEPLSIEGKPPVPGDDHVSPNDWELFAEGRIEGRAATPAISSDETAWLQESGLDRLRGPGAWAFYDRPGAVSRATLQPSGAPPQSTAKEGGEDDAPTQGQPDE